MHAIPAAYQILASTIRHVFCESKTFLDLFLNDKKRWWSYLFKKQGQTCKSTQVASFCTFIWNRQNKTPQDTFYNNFPCFFCLLNDRKKFSCHIDVLLILSLLGRDSLTCMDSPLRIHEQSEFICAQKKGNKE